MGCYYLQHKEYDRAESLFKEAIEIIDTINKEEGTEDEFAAERGFILGNIGETFAHKGDYQKSVNYFDAAISQHDKVILGNEEVLAPIFLRLAGVFTKMNNPLF